MLIWADSASMGELKSVLAVSIRPFTKAALRAESRCICFLRWNRSIFQLNFSLWDAREARCESATTP